MHPDRKTACLNKRPAMTNDSLLASKTFLPDSTAAIVDLSPILPTIPAITMSTVDS